MCPFAMKTLARREWPTLAVRLAGRKFLIRTPEIPHFRIVPEISGYTS